MKIYVYWNRNDNDCTKIFHFMSPNDNYSIIDTLKASNVLKIDRIYQPFRELKKMQIMDDIRNNDLIIFLTHGAEDEILKYRNNPNKDADYILINKENVDVFKDKIILAFCCASAKKLGRLSVSDKVGCKAFVGFEKDIVYDNGRAKKSRHIIYESYKIAFMKSLKYAVENNCTVQEYRIRLMQLLRKEATKAILKSKDHTLNNIYSGTIDGLVALGDTNQKVIS